MVPTATKETRVNPEWKTRATAALSDISRDAQADVANLEGKPLTGRLVAEQFGNQGAAISALSNILKQLIEGEPQ